MDDIFENVAVLARTSLAISLDQTTLSEKGSTGHISVDQVRIIPSKLRFTDAFDGKRFKKKFTIINCGKYPAFVRILPPTSQAFKMKHLRKGQYLPSGLSVTRTVYYTHTNAMAVKHACLFIYVNDKPITYKIEVHMIAAHVTVKPKVLNFGKIDVGNASEQLSIELRNKGHRLAPFSIDLGRNDLELIVDPMKGSIMPQAAIMVTVEVLGSQIGRFNKEFWIKTEPPRRVKLTGIFIAPTVEVEYSPSPLNFTLVDFPKTFYGAESIKTMLITNNSSTDRMFCLVCERGRELVCFPEALKTNDNLKCFSFNCLEGRLMARQNHILRFTFTPLKLKTLTKKFCQAFIRIIGINYRDGIVAERDDVMKTFVSSASVEEYLSSPMESLQEFDDIEIPETKSVRICLYGEMEEPCVKFSPADFTVNYLNVDETYHRIVNVRNCSQDLPIIFKTNVVPSIKLNPAQGVLGPDKSVEITLSITPTEDGERCYKVLFDLFHREYFKEFKVDTIALPVTFSAAKKPPKLLPKFNPGITPKLTNEVGFLVDDVRFNTPVAKPRQAIVDKNYWTFNKNNKDLVAFPNDMPKCLRPSHNPVPCRTIFANLPRVNPTQDEYTLTAEELAKKEQNDKKYSDYIKTLAPPKPKTRSTNWNCNIDYDNSKNSHLLLENIYESKGPPQQIIRRYGCIPLPPAKLMEVDIQPKYVYLGKIAPYTTCTDSFSIENRNEFSIHVAIKALSNSVIIKGKSRIVIGAKKTRNIFFDCFSHGYGKFYVPVYIIINDNHIFDGTVFASVVPTTVMCDQKQIVINPKTHRSFFELYNPVNCDINFAWEIQDKNFYVVPESGIIPSRKNVYCSVTFVPQINATYKTEIYLLSQSGAKQIIPVLCNNDRASVGFSSDIVQFENIPLNLSVERYIVLRNFSDEDIMYLVDEPNPIPEITITPTVGKINAKSDVDFVITAHFRTVANFDCTISFIMQDVYSYSVSIVGNVVFPTISITPVNIQIPKVPTGCYQRHSFKIKNTSATQNIVSFLLEDIPEFTVTDAENHPISDNITLNPNEGKDLILEFKPTEPVAYSLFFPYQMNHIIGPPILNEPRSLRPNNYFELSASKSSVELPRSLKTLNIRCAAGVAWFKFSSLYFLLYYEPKGKGRRRFSITNISQTTHHFTIPLIDEKEPFTMKLDKKEDYTLTETYWEFYIEPKETVSFKIEYSPFEYGRTVIELPLYVRGYIEESPFNYLKLIGEYPKPIITCDTSLVYFQSITAKEKVTKKVTVEFNYHEDECTVNVEGQDDRVSVRSLRRTDAGRLSEVICNSVSEYIIKFEPKVECNVHSLIVFTCSCDARCEIIVRASADNCIFSSYQSYIKNRAIAEGEKFESSFPYYPTVLCDTYYARTLKVIKEDIESWLFTQGYFYKGFYKVPYGLARFPVDIQPRVYTSRIFKPRVKDSSKSTLVLPLVQLLINLVNSKVTKFFDDKSIQQCYTGVEGVTYVYTIYKNIISFLESQGVFVSQLKPEYLLPYNKYLIFKEQALDENSNREGIMPVEEFGLFTKQVWLDLILRIYRVFVYNRASNPFVHHSISESSQPEIYGTELEEYLQEHSQEFPDTINETERKLLLWMEFHFDKQRFVLWDEKVNAKLNGRKIRTFENDLTDSMPLATLMVAYCPYMRRCFDNFFPMYQNDEDIYHNACMIYETWKRLHFSYELRPARIVKPSVTEMEILASYLYEVLPMFYPKETITFKASLGEISSYRIVLKNHGDSVIAYTPLFFLNETEAFTVDVDVVKIPPGATRDLKVTYKAKSILKREAVLVLSGETIGYKFARTMTFNLEGIPDIFAYTEEFVRTVELFKPTLVFLDMISPFEMAYEAKLYVHMGDQKGEFIDHSALQCVADFIKSKLPRQVYVQEDCKFDSNGEGQIRLHMVYIAHSQYTYYVYLLNKEVGDFCIKLIVNVVFPERRAVDIEAVLPSQFSTERCTCRSRSMDMKCPRMISIQIPCQNKQLMEGLKTMLKYAEDCEFNFWEPLLGSPKGFRILREYLENTFDETLVKYKEVLKQKVTYEVQATQSKKFTFPKTITIEDITSPDTKRMEIHWNSNKFPERELLKLISLNAWEIRKYTLKFIRAEYGSFGSS